MYLRCMYSVHICPKYYIALLVKSSTINIDIYTVHTTNIEQKKIMVRRIKATIEQIESVLTP
jgi:hypothetical protein